MTSFQKDSNSVNLSEPRRLHLYPSFSLSTYFIILCSTEVDFGAFLILLPVSFYITWFSALHIFNRSITPLLLSIGRHSFSIIWQYFVLYDHLKKKKNKKQNTRRRAKNNLWYHGVTTVGHEESLYQMCYSCTQQCSNYFDFLSLKLLILLPSAFHTCVREAKVLSLSVFCALVSMYGKCYKKICCGGIDSTLVMEENEIKPWFQKKKVPLYLVFYLWHLKQPSLAGLDLSSVRHRSDWNPEIRWITFCLILCASLRRVT